MSLFSTQVQCGPCVFLSLVVNEYSNYEKLISDLSKSVNQSIKLELDSTFVGQKIKKSRNQSINQWRAVGRSTCYIRYYSPICCRVCKVGGKHSTPCRERVLESGITALEMELTRDNNFNLKYVRARRIDSSMKRCSID